MVDTVFSFSQRGGFHFESPSQWQLSQQVPGLYELFHHSDDDIKIASTHSVTLGEANSFFVSYQSKNGSTRLHSRAIPANLSSFLYEKESGDYKRDFPKLKVTLGPYNKSWFATDESMTRWHNLPVDLMKEINSKRDNNGTGAFNDNPRLVALGCDGNYFMATENGSWAWLLSSYPDLQAIIRGCKDTATGVSNIKNLVLHPYRVNCWILQTQSGLVVSCGLPPHIEEPFNNIKDAIVKDTEKRMALLEGIEKAKAEKAQLERFRAEQAAVAEMKRRQDIQLAQIQQMARRQQMEYAMAQRLMMRQMQNQMAAMTLGMMMGSLGSMNFGNF